MYQSAFLYNAVLNGLLGQRSSPLCRAFPTEPFVDRDGQSILVTRRAGAWLALDTFWGQIGELTLQHLIGEDIVDQLITGTETEL